MPSKRIVSTTINGRPHEFLCEPRHTLLEVLRDVLDLTGTKEGCSNGNCGACTVILNGRPVDSCLVLGVEVEGADIQTIEGIAPQDGLHGIQQAFLEEAALQCGICTPGFIVAAKAPPGQGAGTPSEGRNPPLAGRQPLPLHRLRQDHPRRAGCGNCEERLRGCRSPPSARSPPAVWPSSDYGVFGFSSAASELETNSPRISGQFTRLKVLPESRTSIPLNVMFLPRPAYSFALDWTCM